MRLSPIWTWLAAPALISSQTAAAQVFLTEAQALEAAFGKELTVHQDGRTLLDPARRALEEKSGLRFPENAYVFFVGEQQGKVTGYALVLNEIGKSEPITFLVAMSPEGRVTDVLVMQFRESRGAEVKEKRFLRQFRGKRVSDSLRVSEDIVNYTGATLSSKAIARGVKRALVLLEHFYSSPPTRKAPQLGQVARPALTPARATNVPNGVHRQIRYLMGTLCEVRVVADSPDEAARAFSAAFAELHRLDARFSNYRADSELSRVNQQAREQPVPVSAEFWDLTRAAVRYWRRSAGTFDVTVGPLVRAWGFRGGEGKVASAGELREALACTGSQYLLLDRRARTLRFLRPGMEMDFGGLAKGYACDRTAQVLRRRGVRAGVVNLGGSSLGLFGSPGEQKASDEVGWLVAVADPRDGERTGLLFEVRGKWKLSTSGTYERQFAAGGRILSHIIDPRNGEPLAGRRSATMLAHSGRRAEAWSKQLLFCGAHSQHLWPRALRRGEWVLLEELPGGGLQTRRRLTRQNLLTPAEVELEDHS